MYFSKDSVLSTGVEDYRKKINSLDSEISDKTKKLKNNPETVSWGTPVIWGLIFLAFTVGAIYSTVSDIKAYYNVKYAPMPGYMVDLADIITTADDGTKTVIRNDTAYYAAVLTNAVRTGEDKKAMLCYADLNGDKGKQWLGLYSAKTGGDPILANSLKVVTGTSSLPDGYSTGIHMFGSDAAFNLTDSRYCYNDDANGVYAYFRREAAAVPPQPPACSPAATPPSWAACAW